MAEIYYGLQFKELVLPRDRRYPGGTTMVDRAALGRQSELHHVVHAIRRRVRFGRAPENPRETLSELAPLGARLIIQRAVEDEFDAWLGRAV